MGKYTYFCYNRTIMPKQKQPQKISKDELYPILFDSLMVHIEADLMIENREMTADFLSRLTDEERAWQMKQYEEAYAIFLDNWPDHVERALKKLRTMLEDLREKGIDIDVQKMKDIEHSLEDFSDYDV